ncbi:hypothetical protein AUJ77_01715 [Candidatus Nomurabacteria bacterium CG1_02_43_90]|uniref:Uncharacterized protein n=1 Tax=Candidatus Nomurabacteria bacterium CG1_02_43_90 TaxID=1805281 RepID=A0A1J4V116_9BACT|nr:MAG: hypothetical protein AUJ77_01715 [Candidatus Nomurabacteria bacterium CG1_02_43_90]
MSKKTLTQEEINKDLYARLEKLESLLSGGKHVKVKENKSENFSGAKGGILLLISKRFFSKKRNAPETKVELDKFEYFYNIQVVQTTLNRLSNKTGPLITMDDKGKKVYVKRK